MKLVCVLCFVQTTILEYSRNEKGTVILNLVLVLPQIPLEGERRSPSKQRRAESRAARGLAEAEAEEEARLAELLAQNLMLEELGEERMSLLT